MSQVSYNEKGQAIPQASVPIEKEAFEPSDDTKIYWLGNAGALIHSHNTNLLIDPVLSGFDMPLLIDVPIKEEDLGGIDAVLLTHSDNDHYSRSTSKAIKDRTGSYHAPHYVADLLKEELDIDGVGHDIHDEFELGDTKIKLTPAWHNWQNESPKHHTRDFKMEDYCGFWIDTPDGSIWAIGDSRLLDEQLEMEQPDAILFDFSDSKWHIGFEQAVRLANTYPDTPLILWHWGSVDAPEWKEFNGDPNRLKEAVINPERVIVLAPGEPFTLKEIKEVI